MKISKRYILLFVLGTLSLGTFAQIGMQELGDSLMAYTGFSRVWAPAVRVKQMRINGNNVTLRTNGTLRDVRWTPDNVAELKRKVSLWTLGHEKGAVTIYSSGTDIETLITDCARQTAKQSNSVSGLTAKRSNSVSDLTDRKVVLYPSHGLYFNRDRNEWIWQRATLWTTVEDLYSQEYVRLIRRMLENAGATVLSPRAGLEQQALGASGMPRWTEGARYWLVSQGADSALWNLYEGNEYKDDMKCRAMWVNDLPDPMDLCLALHTDGLDSGDDTTIVGTLAIYTAKDDDSRTTLRDGRDRERVNRNLADWIQTQVTTDLQTIAPEWTRRQLREANYCESRVPVVPGIILELLSHKNMADMKYGLDPTFRFAAARAVYKGILRYLNGRDAIVQPLPVRDLGILPSYSPKDGLTAEGGLTTQWSLQWKPSLDSIEQTASPSYYMVYIQADDGEWVVQQVEKATSLSLELKPGVKYNYYVVAGNDGGLSFPSPVISAYLNEEAVTGYGLPDPESPITHNPSPVTHNPSPVTRNPSPITLIVDGFNDAYGPEWFADSTYAGIVPGSYACEDGFSCAYIGQQWDYTRASQWINDDNCGWGACYRDHAGQLTVGNTRDWSARHGHILRKMNISYVSCTAGMMEEAVTGYRLPVTESPVTHNPSPVTHNPSPVTHNPSPITLIDFICGRNREPLTADHCSRITDYLNHGGRLLLSTDHFSAIDGAWAMQNLHAAYYAAQATRSGRITSPRHRLYQLILEPNEEQLFTCTPEAIRPTDADAVKMAAYEDMRCTAAVGTPRTLVYAFPLEAVQDFEKIYRHSVKWLLER